jgi:hypothetical protein
VKPTSLVQIEVHSYSMNSQFQLPSLGDAIDWFL